MLISLTSDFMKNWHAYRKYPRYENSHITFPRRGILFLRQSLDYVIHLITLSAPHQTISTMVRIPQMALTQTGCRNYCAYRSQSRYSRNA